MNIDLSQDEIEVLCDALKTWEKDAGSTAFMTSMLSAVFAPEHKKDEYRKKEDERFTKAEQEGKRRETRSLLLRAKLVNAIRTQIVGTNPDSTGTEQRTTPVE